MKSLSNTDIINWLDNNNPKLDTCNSNYSQVYKNNGKKYVIDYSTNQVLEVYVHNIEKSIMNENAPLRVLKTHNYNFLKNNFNQKSNKITEKLENDELNPALWNKDKKLIPEVRQKILDLVDEVKQYLDDIDLKVLDIQLVGSNANYNYTDKSDVDVHIITNFDSYGTPEETVAALMQSNKTNFNNAYDINYKGYNVEIYIQDVKSSTLSKGVYSVLNDEWIKLPEKIDIPEVDLEPELSEYKKEIKKAIEDNDSDYISKIIDELYLLRRNALMVDGEFGKGNLIFKAIRNDGLLDELKEKRNEIKSKELSLENKN